MRHAGLYDDEGCEMWVECTLYAYGEPLLPSLRTAHRRFAANEPIEWNEWFTFDIEYSELPRSTSLVFTVYDVGPNDSAAVVGGSTFPLCVALALRQRIELIFSA